MVICKDKTVVRNSTSLNWSLCTVRAMVYNRRSKLDVGKTWE